MECHSQKCTNTFPDAGLPVLIWQRMVRFFISLAMANLKKCVVSVCVCLSVCERRSIIKYECDVFVLTMLSST